MKIASLAAGIDPAACVRTRVVAQGCFSLPKLICAAFGMILVRKTYQIDQNPPRFRPAGLHGNIVDFTIGIIPVRIFQVFRTSRRQKSDNAKTKLLNKISPIGILVLS